MCFIPECVVFYPPLSSRAVVRVMKERVVEMSAVWGKYIKISEIGDRLDHVRQQDQRLSGLEINAQREKKKCIIAFF